MNKNKKLWLTVALTALIAFPAGWVFGNGAINRGLVNALGSVGENLLGEGNFGASIVDVDGTGLQAVQIDVGVPPEPVQPPDPVIPVLLNVFVPPDPVMVNPVCGAFAQIAVTSDGITVFINEQNTATQPPEPVMVIYGDPLGQPPEPCLDDNVIDPGPG